MLAFSETSVFIFYYLIFEELQMMLETTAFKSLTL